MNKMDSEIKRNIILDHYQNPRNKGLTGNKDYKTINMNNESCIDEVNLEIKVENGIIKDIKFDGEACAICTSSSSIMTDTLIGKTTEEAKKVLQNFLNMLDEKPYDKEILEEAIVYDDIHKQPNRKKCALLSWWGIEKLLNELEAQK
ncbi:MAG TPA: SUF system NifU family Fe-S cluster assembly protein [Candidatus Coprosoma intestinipullorum]|uniref:SUF system NifU family Fe-S cluster assembly protein n=1 Tax=Candidatus Coprosoma intestinipullorum TaxID=2840752 RepID=A0A9D1CYA3_9FIRM|nr:SUF system NifU family Fe-S cluster assembly protein [Candidatus Coprosoma intestinipullorum]